jgi:hypothetical protein
LQILIGKTIVVKDKRGKLPVQKKATHAGNISGFICPMPL